VSFSPRPRSKAGWSVCFDHAFAAAFVELPDAFVAELGQPLHSTQRCEKGGWNQGGRLAVDLQVLTPVAALRDTHRAVAIPGLDVPHPGVGRLQDMTIGVDYEFGSHNLLPAAQAVGRASLPAM
jgi:hypothetical protein